MGEEASTEVRVIDTPESSELFYRYGAGLLEFYSLAKRLERERNLALAIARKYYNGPELKDFPNVKV